MHLSHMVSASRYLTMFHDLKYGRALFCRKCGKKLEYQFFHYGQLGLYHCPNCGWNRPNPEYTAEHVVREDELYSFDMDGIHFDPQIRTPYNIYNTLSAYAALKTMGAGYEHFERDDRGV